MLKWGVTLSSFRTVPSLSCSTNINLGNLGIWSQ
ncbi:MAG: hypothetical protein H6P99_1455 [Holophagaceae bacterium]|nr:hypothetical protein [Holophagaceae bacterium]